MARSVQHVYLQVADGEGLAVAQQAVELDAIAGHVVQVEHRPEDGLHIADVFPNGHPGAGACLQVGRRAQVVRMGVGLQDPGHLQRLGSRRGQHLVG